MKTAVILVLFCIIPAMVFAESVQISSMPDGTKYFTDRFIVTTQIGVPSLELNKVSGGKAISGVNSIDYLCGQQNITQIEPWYPGIVKTPIIAELVNRMYVFHVAPGADVLAARDAFRANSDIECADIYDIPEFTYFPNDPQRTQQWHLTRTQAYQAWDIFRGDTTRYGIVGIVDTGVYWHHPDLNGNMWVNPYEDIDGDGLWTNADINGVDDDGNGYVDDGVGWDMARQDNDPSEEGAIHGTHVAGDASENTDNGINGAGIGFHVRLMAVKGGRHDTLTSVYPGMTYAADNGAKVINLSVGAPSGTKTLEDAVNHAILHPRT